MHDVVVPTSKIVILRRTIEALLARPRSTEGMAVVYGETGQGKTTAVAETVNKVDGIYVRAWSTWSSRSMLESIVLELDRSPTYALDPMARVAADLLREQQKPLFIDEADYLVRPTSSKRRPLDLVRDLYDEAQTPVVLIGSPDFAKRLRTASTYAKHARRVSAWVAFDGITRADGKRVVAELAEVDIEDRLIDRMIDVSAGNIASLVEAVRRIEALAATNGLDRVSDADWGRRQLPAPSRFGFSPEYLLS